MSYFNGHIHTQYSNIRMLDCIIKENQAIDYAIELGLEGIALTDHESLGGHVKALNYMKKLKEKANLILDNQSSTFEEVSWAKRVMNFRLGLGNEIYLTRDDLTSANYTKGEDGFWHFILIAKDEIGHKQLRQLSSVAWSHSFKQFIERVPTYLKDIEEIIYPNKGHLIATTACLGGQFPKLLMTGQEEKALNFCRWCQEMFGEENFFIEIQPGESEEQLNFNSLAFTFSTKYNIKVTTATDAHYLKKEDRPIHKAYLNSNDGDREVDAFYATTYIMDEKELIEKLSINLPESFVQETINNSIYIKSQIQEYDLTRNQVIPKIPLDWTGVVKIPFNEQKYSWIIKFLNSDYEVDRLYGYKILNGLKNKNIFNDKHLERVNIELEQIWKLSEKQGDRLSSYFITVQKIIDIMWENDAIVGVGRGSVFTHLCSYCLDIIQSDPLESPIDLPWWRFLSEERPEYPKPKILG